MSGISLVGIWFDPTGTPLLDGTNESQGILVLRSSAGSTSCTDEHVTVFMEIAWPPACRLDWNKSDDDESDAHRYIRDTEGSLMATDGEPDLDTSLPADVVDTAINREGNLLYAKPTQPTAIWIRRPDGHIERWAPLGHVEGCA